MLRRFVGIALEPDPTNGALIHREVLDALPLSTVTLNDLAFSTLLLDALFVDALLSKSLLDGG